MRVRSGIAMTKKATRTLLKSRLAELDDRTIFAHSYTAALKLCDLPQFEAARVVMLFLSMPGEIDTSQALLQTLLARKTLVVPRIDWPNRELVPHVIETLNCHLTMGKHGLREPAGQETVAPEAIDLVVVPGLGFDEEGNRIGRGAGFYDRFLADERMRAIRCGIAFECQLLETLPVVASDVPVHLLVTEKTVRRFRY